MTVTAIGEVPLGSAVPAVNGAFAAALADIDDKLAALLSFAPQITPPSLTADLVVAGQIAANAAANVALGVVPPSAFVDLKVNLEATLHAQLQLLLQLGDLLLASVHVYKYEGQTGNFGTEMQTELSAGLPGGSGTDTALAITLIATVAPEVAAMKKFFAH